MNSFSVATAGVCQTGPNPDADMGGCEDPGAGAGQGSALQACGAHGLPPMLCLAWLVLLQYGRGLLIRSTTGRCPTGWHRGCYQYSHCTNACSLTQQHCPSCLPDSALCHPHSAVSSCHSAPQPVRGGLHTNLHVKAASEASFWPCAQNVAVCQAIGRTIAL